MAPSCASAVREGGGEASVGVHAGWVIEPRNQCFRVPTSLNEAGGNIVGGVFVSRWRSSAVEEPVHAWSLRAREPGDPMAARRRDGRVGRSGKAEAVRLR